MSEHTHCDRCGAVDKHKGSSTLTREFPGKVLLSPHSSNVNSLMNNMRTRELCLDCSAALAEFLDDTELAEEMTPEGYERDENLPATR